MPLKSGVVNPNTSGPYWFLSNDKSCSCWSLFGKLITNIHFNLDVISVGPCLTMKILILKFISRIRLKSWVCYRRFKLDGPAS